VEENLLPHDAQTASSTPPRCRSPRTAASLHTENPPFIAIPAFPVALLPPLVHLHLVEGAASASPRDLKGKARRRARVPDDRGRVWIRGILSDDHGVKVTDYEHLSGGEEEPGRIDKLKIDLPSSIRIRPIGGEPDTVANARRRRSSTPNGPPRGARPSTFHKRPDDVKRLFPDYVAAEERLLPPHQDLPDHAHRGDPSRRFTKKIPGWAQSLYKALGGLEKRRAMEMYRQTAALPAMVPWLTAHIEEARREMGEDWWPYGLDANRHVLDTFLRYHHEQGPLQAPPQARGPLRLARRSRPSRSSSGSGP